MQVGMAKIVFFDQWLAFRIRSTTGRVQSTVFMVDLAWTSIYLADRHASVNLAYHSSMDDYAEENRAEFNCPHW